MRALPRRLMNYVQFCDGPAEYDTTDSGLIYIAREARLMPGEGGIDLAGLARSLGVAAHRVEDGRAFDARFAEALAGGEPVLLDVIVDGSV